MCFLKAYSKFLIVSLEVKIDRKLLFKKTMNLIGVLFMNLARCRSRQARAGILKTSYDNLKIIFNWDKLDYKILTEKAQHTGNRLYSLIFSGETYERN